MKKFTFLFSILVLTNLVKAQCTAPSFSVNLSAATDTTWILSGQTRSGTCCGSSNCVTFVVTLNPNSELISFDVTNPSPSGSAYYQVNCGTPVSIGTPLCVVGLASPLTITYCKPGGDAPDYVITAASVVQGGPDLTIQETNCHDTLTVANVIPSTVNWTSIYPTPQGAYNSYLSCTAGCTATIVTPGPNPPAYVDYMVSGTPTFTCGATMGSDTIRVYFVPTLSATITPPNAILCSSPGSQLTLTANPSGGAAPYNYTWSTGPNSQSINVNSAGTYSVLVGDATKCPKVSAVTTVSSLPSASFSYSLPDYCNNVPNPSPVYSGNAQPGVFSASPSGLVFVNTSTGEINLSASAPGTYTVTNTIPASNGCPSVSASTVLTINPFPVMTSTASVTICTGSSVNLNFSSSSPATYNWVGSDNTSVSGESLTPQTGGLLSDLLVNTSGASQLVVYTVSPTSTGAGACPGLAQTINVTVNPLEDPTFSFTGSTFCETGTDPSPNISGLPGGSFASGNLSVNASTGTVDLSAGPLGTYTVSYTTAGPCPNTSTVSITITDAPSAAFSYTAIPFCTSDTDPIPNLPQGSSGGIFSSAPGLVIDSLTGQVNLSASTPGTYTITNTVAASGGCAAELASVLLTVEQAATADANLDQTICFGDQVILNGAIGGGASSASWSGGNGSFTGGVNNLNTIYIPNSADSLAGSVVLVLTTDDPAGVCPAVSDVMTLTIKQPAVVNTKSDEIICYGTSIPLSAIIGGSATSGSWSGGAGSFSPTPGSLNATYIPASADSAAGSVTLIVTTDDPSGVCPAVSDTLVITIEQPAVANANADQTICYGTSVTLGGMIGGSAGSASWSGGAGSFSPNAGTLNATYVPTSADSAAGISVLVLTTEDPAGVCPAVSDTMIVTINQPAAVNAGSDLAICYGFAVQLNGSFGGSALSSAWTGGSGTFVPDNTAPGATYIPSAADSAAGVITLVLTTDDPQGVCSAEMDMIIITIDQPAVVSASSDQAICYGSPVALNGGLGGSASSVTWNGGSGSFSPNANTPGATYIPCAGDSLAGAITLVLSTDDPAGVCPAVNDTMTILIAQPALANASADQTICFGSSVPLAGSFGGCATGATWAGGTGVFLPGTNTPGATYVPSQADSLAGAVTLVLTTDEPSSVCAAVSDTMTIYIDQPATVNAGAGQTICYGNSVNLGGAIGGNASGATWSGGAGAFTPNANTLNATYIPNPADSLAGSVTFTLTTDDPNGVCPAVSDVVTIVINSLPTAPVVTVPGYTYCASETVAPLVANGVGTVLWSTNASMSPIINSGSTYTPGALPLGTTTYYFIDSLGTGCKSATTGSVSITVNANPAVPVLTSGSYTYCQSAAVGSINSNAGATAIWSTSSGMNPVINIGSSYTPASLPLGSTTFYVVDSVSTGCKSVGSGSITVTIYPNPELSGTPVIDSANCGLLTGGITGIQVTSGTPGYTYQWYNGSAPIAGANSATLGAVGAGSYSVLVTDANGCVATGGTTSFVVPASSTISSDFTASPVSGTAPLTCVFISTTGGVSTYNWTLGNGTTCTAPSAEATYTAAGTYTVILVTTLGTCTSAKTETIVVAPVPDVVIPNIFTPNGDGINDVFTINAEGITDLHSEIYNRWGTLIQTLDGVHAGWDGKSNKDETVVDGTYFVILKARTIEGKDIEKQGYVTLLR